MTFVLLEPFQAPSFLSYSSGQGWCLLPPGRPHQPTFFGTFSAPSHSSFFSSLSWGSSCLHRLSQPLVCLQTPPQLHSVVEETFPVSSVFSVVLLYFSRASALHSPLPPQLRRIFPILMLPLPVSLFLVLLCSALTWPL